MRVIMLLHLNNICPIQGRDAAHPSSGIEGLRYGNKRKKTAANFCHRKIRTRPPRGDPASTITREHTFQTNVRPRACVRRVRAPTSGRGRSCRPHLTPMPHRQGGEKLHQPAHEPKRAAKHAKNQHPHRKRRGACCFPLTLGHGLTKPARKLRATRHQKLATSFWNVLSKLGQTMRGPAPLTVCYRRPKPTEHY